MTPCLLQVRVLSKQWNKSSWFLAWELPSTCPTLCYKELRIALCTARSCRMGPSATADICMPTRWNFWLRVVWQHLQDILELDMSALDWMMKAYPDVKEREDMRRIVGRYGLTGTQQVLHAAVWCLSLKTVTRLGRRSSTVERPSTRTTAAETYLRLLQTISENSFIWRPKRLVTFWNL